MQNNKRTSSVSHTGATEIASDTSLENAAYSSVTGGENALLVSGGIVTLTNPSVTKSGDESSENSDFYGTNAAILATNGTLSISGGSVTTSGAHANGIFAYGSGKIIANNVKVTTSNNNSGGVMVTGGGTLEATNLTVETAGNSSASIRSDRGGGTMTISGGSYKTTGVGSPAIYSTADISVSDAELVSTASEGVVIEGSNSVSLSNVTLTDTNTTLNGNSETYKNIFIYQSMSGDAEEGTGTFSAANSLITTNKGDTFFVTNTTANISLSGNQIVNNDETSAFLRAQSGKWGTSGSNGGLVTLNLSNQVVEGDIVLDNISTLSMYMTGSFYMGAINSSNSAHSVSLTLDADSQVVLAGDTYLTSLDNADSSNMNIYANGNKLYVGGSEVEVNGSVAPEAPEIKLETTDVETTETVETVEEMATSSKEIPMTAIVVAVIAVLAIIVAIIALVFHNKKKNQVPPTTPPVSSENPFHPSNGDPGIDVPENPGV